ncbi:MAG TPA: class I SAM-dependent methyltransferase [Chloroflexota bacterium]|nr:class I SAM-dependent methyltransferase [Chloroflexota bacterium]
MLDAIFPRASRYDTAWAEAHSLGENVLHFAESLGNVLPLQPGQRVLDLGCGHALSSIFLAREFGVTVWAVDRGVDPTANYERAAAMDCADRVFPLRADVRALPLPHGYFDAAVALDSYFYFGTDERFLLILARYLKPGAYLGVVDACMAREIASADELPPAARAAWQLDWWGVHTIAWWCRHLEKTGLVRVLRAELLPESDIIKQQYVARYRDDPAEASFIALMEAEDGQLVGHFRLVAQRTARPVQLEDDADCPY